MDRNREYPQYRDVRKLKNLNLYPNEQEKKIIISSNKPKETAFLLGILKGFPAFCATGFNS